MLLIDYADRTARTRQHELLIDLAYLAERYRSSSGDTSPITYLSGVCKVNIMYGGHPELRACGS